MLLQVVILSHLPFRMCRNKWTAWCRKNVGSSHCSLERFWNLWTLLWSPGHESDKYETVSSKTVIRSPYIFPVLSEMKICQFMCWHDRGDATAYYHSSSTDIYQLCFWRNSECDICFTPSLQTQTALVDISDLFVQHELILQIGSRCWSTSLKVC